MGKLIVIEGLDGSGKSTQTPLLERELKEQGRNVMVISFPVSPQMSMIPFSPRLGLLFNCFRPW